MKATQSLPYIPEGWPLRANRSAIHSPAWPSSLNLACDAAGAAASDSALEPKSPAHSSLAVQTIAQSDSHERGRALPAPSTSSRILRRWPQRQLEDHTAVRACPLLITAVMLRSVRNPPILAAEIFRTCSLADHGAQSGLLKRTARGRCQVTSSLSRPRRGSRTRLQVGFQGSCPAAPRSDGKAPSSVPLCVCCSL